MRASASSEPKPKFIAVLSFVLLKRKNKKGAYEAAGPRVPGAPAFQGRGRGLQRSRTPPLKKFYSFTSDEKVDSKG